MILMIIWTLYSDIKLVGRLKNIDFIIHIITNYVLKRSVRKDYPEDLDDLLNFLSMIRDIRECERKE